MEIVSLNSTIKCTEKNAQSSGDERLTDSNNNHESWSVRDQLMLISFAIVNGDSNWSYVCDQMNKFSNFGFKKKTSAQSAKQYRQIINDFLNKSEQSENKNQLIDLKKIYDQIASERLDQVNCSIRELKDNYGQICSQISQLIDLESNESSEPPISDKFKAAIVQWLSINVDIGEEKFDQRYNQNLIAKLNQIKANNDLNEQLVELLEKDADFKRQEDEQEAERMRLEEEEREAKKRLDEEKRLKMEQEELNKIEVKMEAQIDEENSKDSSRFSSEDDMPLLNIVKSKGLLNDVKTKSPSPAPNEKVRRSLRKAGNKTEEAASPNHMSSASSTVSTISHKSISLPCSSLSEDKEVKHEVKPSPSNTSSVYDNLDADDNQEVYKSKKKSAKKTEDEPPAESSGNLVSIKQEPKDGHNISGSSLSSVSSSKTSEDEKTHRAWKKSIMMILNNISCHKHATIFMHPVKDEIAPGYSTLIHRPIDLSTIKKNIETGSTRTTKEFQRDIMLMFTNALMYNSTNHNIHKIALEMFKEVLADIEQLLNAQESLCSTDNMDSSGYTLSKPLRYKDMRSSSTASDGKSSIVSSQNALHDGQHDESVAGLLAKKGRPIKETKTNSKSSLKDESINDAGSIKSNSSVSTPRQSSTRSRVSSAVKLNQQKSPKMVVKKEEAFGNGKKRKPSNSSTNLNNSSSQNTQVTKNIEEDVPKSKRRKSGR